MDAHTKHIHQTEVVTIMSRLPQAGSTKVRDQDMFGIENKQKLSQYYHLYHKTH